MTPKPDDDEYELKLRWKAEYWEFLDLPLHIDVMHPLTFAIVHKVRYIPSPSY